MDFSYLLELAKANQEKKDNDKSHKFSTKVSSAKKESRPAPNVKAINKVLSKLDQEKKKKEDVELEKKSNLLALRSQNKHSKKRVHTLINRTKGASKSVLDDAKDITTAIGETQCDEDDYGYESTISQQIFSKLQNTYSELPEDERLKFQKTKTTNLEDVKNRVASSLKKNEEEKLGIRKRKRHRRSRGQVEEDGFINDGDAYQDFSGPGGKEELQVTSKQSSKADRKKVTEHFGPTKVDKYANFKYKNSKPEGKDKKKENKEKKRSPTEEPSMNFQELMKMAQKNQSKPLPMFDPLKEMEQKKKDREKKLEESRPMTAKEKKDFEEEQRLRNARKAGKMPPPPVPKSKHSAPEEPKEKAAPPPPPQPKVLDRSKYYAASSGSKPALSTSKLLPTKLPAKAITSNKSAPPSKRPPPTEPPKKKMRPSPPPPISNGRRVVSDSESDEYDSEMDDFIDDGDDDQDYSKHISQIFKYDKSKYVNEPEDDADMEASYSQVQQEEKHSARLGLLEDLEDIKREEEDYKRKKMLKIKNKRPK